MSATFLGIDAGNTATKAVVVDSDGNLLGMGASHEDTDLVVEGRADRSLGKMWHGVVDAVQAALGEAGLAGGEVSGVGVAGHGNGLYLLGPDLEPIRLGIRSVDTRASEMVKRRRIDGIEQELFELILQRTWPGQMNALLPWLRDNEPDTYSRIGHVLACKDYVRYRLTGKIATDVTDMSGAGLLNVFTREYDPRILELLGLSDLGEVLPQLHESHDLIGEVTPAAARETGLKAGTPVIAGMFDVNAGLIGCGTTNSDQLIAIAGTWSINEMLVDAPLRSEHVEMMTVSSLDDWWLALEGSATAAANLDWLLNRLGLHGAVGVGRSDLEQSIGLVGRDWSAPLFQPFLFGSNVDPVGTASFVGLTGSHTQAHLVRAAFEGVAFSHRQHVDRLLHVAQPETVTAAGGMTRSRVWSQMLADVLAMPVNVVATSEATAVGAAMAAAVGTGAFSSYEQGAKAMVERSRRYEPDPEAVDFFQWRYDRYQDLALALKPLWDALDDERPASPIVDLCV